LNKSCPIVKFALYIITYNMYVPLKYRRWYLASIIITNSKVLPLSKNIHLFRAEKLLSQYAPEIIYNRFLGLHLYSLMGFLWWSCNGNINWIVNRAQIQNGIFIFILSQTAIVIRLMKLSHLSPIKFNPIKERRLMIRKLVSRLWIPLRLTSFVERSKDCII
jgi:hypothetical protein